MRLVSVLLLGLCEHHILPTCAYGRPVFRSMIAIANSASQRNPMSLTHPTVDHSRVVKAALDIIYTVDFSHDNIERDLNLVKYVIDFAKKWDISRITNITRKEIAQVFSMEGLLAVEYLLVAVHLGDNGLAARYYSSQDGFHHYRYREDLEDLEDETETDDLRENPEREQEFTKLPQHYLSDTRAEGLTNELLDDWDGGAPFDFGNMPYGEFLRFRPSSGASFVQKL